MNKNYVPYGVIVVLTVIILGLVGYMFVPHFLASQHMKMMEKGQIDMQQTGVPFPGYSQAMADHCVMMAEMKGCEPYNILREGGSVQSPESQESSFLDTDPRTLSTAKKVEVVELKDGDTYTMEVTQVAKEIGNDMVAMFAYNGSIPGPVLKAPAGSKVTLRFVNKVDGLETTLHSHGLRGDYTMDGVPVDMMGTQEVMKAGDSFDYELVFPDTGIFWYHPHVREDMQQELGLAGNFLVTPREEDFYNPVNSEETLILDDVLIENGKIAPISAEFANYVIMGRFGNTMLVNGDTNYQMQAKTGEVKRLYLTNVSNTRIYDFQIPGVQMKLVGGDIGKYERETFVDGVIIAPAERYIVEVYFAKPGNYELKNITPESEYTLGKIQVLEEQVPSSYQKEFETLRVNQDVISDIDNFRDFFSKAPDKAITLDMDMGGMMMGGMMMGGESHGGIEWEDSMVQMNKMHTSEQVDWNIIEDATGKKNMDIDWEFQKGDVVKVRITNKKNGEHPMQHPIHFHGQRFLVLSENGVTNTNLVWKDTALVKTDEYIDILIDMSNPGEWMTHCHIAEHLSAGMMMHFRVKE